jgi:small conductance mechanosensitive channel
MNQEQKIINRKKAIKLGIEIFIVVVALFFGMFTASLFPDTGFADIIDRTLGKFFDVGSLIADNYLRFIETFTVILFIWILIKVTHWIFVLTLSEKRRQSAGINLLKSFLKYVYLFLGGIFILTAWGVETATLLLSVGLLGLVVSFGAQGLVEDLISGLFIILEKQFEVGDMVFIDGFRGKVLEINLRTTKFLDPSNNDVKYISNSEIATVLNLSQQTSIAFTDMSIEYGADLKAIEKICIDFLPSLKEKYAEIEDTPNYYGVAELADSAVLIRFGALCKEENKFKVRRILNRELKLLFDENKINIPFPQLVLHNQKEE